MGDQVTAVLISGRSEQEGLATLLEEAGYSVLQTHGEVDAVRKVLEEPDVVIFAGRNAQIDGYDLLPLVRSLTDAPIVAIGPDDEATVVDALSWGSDTYVRDDDVSGKLIPRIVALLRRR